MPNLPPLPEAIRASLPCEAQAYVAALEAVMGELRTRVAEVETQVTTLTARLAAAEAQARQHSGNSSRPPSSDPPSAPPRPARPATGKRRGGQPGHRGHWRPLVPTPAVDQVVVHRPTTCPDCELALGAEARVVGEPVRQQVWEVPPVRAHVTEHQYLTVCCGRCQRLVTAARPAGVPSGAFGVRVLALVALLHGRYRLSVRETAAVLGALFGLPISAGGVPRLNAQVSAALAPAYAEALAAVMTSSAVAVDETGWKRAGQRTWLWTVHSRVATVFQVAPQRSGAVVTGLLGAAFGGIVHSDRAKAYRVVPVEQRQVCWAHLDRNFAGLVGWSRAVTPWATRARALVDALFTTWHRFRGGELDRVGLHLAMAPVQAGFDQLLGDAVTQTVDKLRGIAGELRALWPALWTFVSVPGVEPTNNAAERALRPAVLRRKGSFGNHSDHGERFIERLLTVGATCQQHERALLPFLVDTLSAAGFGATPPRLIPIP